MYMFSAIRKYASTKPQSERLCINRFSTERLWSERLWSEEDGQDVAEYSVMLAVILVIVVGTVRLIGSNASGIFSQVGSSLQ
jgi:Flp pilus assembly pilin Flp